MKVDRHLPAVPGVDSQAPRRSQQAQPTAAAQTAQREEAGYVPRTLPLRDTAGFSLVLNQQLSAMQAADAYFDQLAHRLVAAQGALAGGRGPADPTLRARLAEVDELWAQRQARTGGSLDAELKLHLTAPARTRFTLPGLTSLDALRAAGREVLLIRLGNRNEPQVVTLDEVMSERQLLRAFNTALAGQGVRAELDVDGRLVFSVGQEDWPRIASQWHIQGEGGLFVKTGYTRVEARPVSLLPSLTVDDAYLQSHRGELLASIAQALGQIERLRAQLTQRRREVSGFLARQLGSEERDWASGYVATVFELMSAPRTSYAQTLRTLVAQAHLSRHIVVSLLS